MESRPFRFGVSLLQVGSTLAEWRDRARAVEDLGFDVLQMADHLNVPSPIPALMAAAEATSLRLGTYVLNAGVQNPAYLARDVATANRLMEGRLELGLGAGYVEAEFSAAGLPFGTPSSRLRKLEQVLTETRRLLRAEPDDPQPAVMIAGAGDKILAFGARAADIISFPVQAGFGAATPEEALASRVARVRAAAGERLGDIELNLFIAGVGEKAADIDLSVLVRASGLTADKLIELPAVLVGPPSRIAETLLRYRDDYGINYISVLEPHMRAFSAVIRLLR